MATALLRPAPTASRRIATSLVSAGLFRIWRELAGTGASSEELFTARDACGFSAHVVIRELGLAIDVTLVEADNERSLIREIDPLGRVPALMSRDGALLTDCTRILPHLADQRPGTTLFAPPGSAERERILWWIDYIHAEIDARRRRDLADVLAPIEAQLAAEPYLAGGRFSIADAYLGAFAARLAPFGGALAAFCDAFEQRPAVRAARLYEDRAIPA